MTPEAPDVTVVVPVYNGARTISACVTSLLALRFDRHRREILVVDNGSTDDTLGELARFGSEISVLHEPVRGVSAARNCGVRAARGRIIALTDADCEVEPDWLSSLVAPLSDSGVGIVGGRILSLFGANHIARFGETIHDHETAILASDLPYVIGMSWASPRNVLLDTGLFDVSLLRGQDVDFSWRIHRAGYRLAYAPGAVLRHHNETTLRGLLSEGYVHGVHAVRLRSKHLGGDAGFARDAWRASRRLLGDLRPLIRAGDRMRALLRLWFDLGKSAGEVVGSWRQGRAAR